MVRRLFLAAFPCLVALIPIASCATGADTVFPPDGPDGGGTDTSSGGDTATNPDAPLGPACKSDTDCKDPGAKKCDPATKTCVACLPTADTCTSGNYCGKDKNGVLGCLPGCKTDPDCAGLADAGAGDASADGGFVQGMTPACCDHVCSNTSADAKNCGKCGTTCGAGAACCNAACQDTQSTLANCGACGANCAPANVATATCTTGTCGYTSCTAPFSDCDLVKSNGCEVDTSKDANNCGVCGKKCALGQQCVGSVCITCGVNEVSYNGKCYYLDGSGGLCDSGYARAAESVMAVIKTQFVGLNYKHTISSNCCIWTSDVLENYGMAAHCNSNGPFTAGEPVLGGTGCSGVQLHGAGQMTFCGN
jgi:hypothetical protein